MRLTKITLALVLMLTCAGFIQAQYETEEGLEYLLFMEIPEVITSTLTKSDPIRAPSTMTVITKNEIKASGARNLMEMINQVPGFIVKKVDTGRHLVTFRGVRTTISNDKIKLLMNGASISEPIWGGFSDFFNIGLENVKQIEIVRGPGSSLYGTNAFACIINVITMTGEDLQGAIVDAKIESFDGMRADFSYGNSAEDMEYDFNINYFDTDGADETLQSDALTGTPLSIAPAKMKENEDHIMYSARMKSGGFALSGFWRETFQDTLVPQLGILTENGETREWDVGFIEASHEMQVSDSLHMKIKLNYTVADFYNEFQVFPNGFVIPFDVDGDGDIEFFPEGGFGEDGVKSEELKAELMLNWEISTTNKLIVGIFGEKIETKDVEFKSNGHPLFLFNLDTLVDFSDVLPWIGEEERNIFGLFFQDELQISDSLYCILGGRYDDYDDFGSTFNPRLGFVWNINQKGGVVKLLYGSAFKAPNFSQLFNQNNPSVIGNTELDPEELKSLELSFGYIFAEKLQTNISIFSVDTKDLIDISTDRVLTSVGTTPFQFVNQGKTETLGVEVDARYAFKENNYFFGSYSYTDAEDSNSNADLAFVPENLFTFGVNLFFAKYINLNINMDYVGERPRESGDTRGDLESETVWNATLRLNNIADTGFDFYVSAYNVTDENVVTPPELGNFPLGDLQRPGATYAAGVSKKF